MEIPFFEVAGARIHAVNLEDTLAVLEEWIAAGRREYVVLTGAQGVVEMQSEPDLLAINNAAGLVTPDGAPNAWLGRWRGFATTEKVYAPDIMHAAFARGVSLGWRHYFYGGGFGVAERLTERMTARYPGLVVAGVHCPPFRTLTEDEESADAARIDLTRPDIVWVGLGFPKQDRWMARFRSRLRAPVLLGVGAGFDFLAGNKPLAPRWIQRSGLEWLFRLITEPRRLWPRYSRVIPRYLVYFAREIRRGRRIRR